jgi:hypothetical protein
VEKIDVIHAKVIALQNAVAALLATHPDKPRLLSAFRDGTNALMAPVLNSPIDEEFAQKLTEELDAYEEIVSGQDGKPR